METMAISVITMCLDISKINQRIDSMYPKMDNLQTREGNHNVSMRNLEI